jgi:hypothetical protein
VITLSPQIAALWGKQMSSLEDPEKKFLDLALAKAKTIFRNSVEMNGR